MTRRRRSPTIILDILEPFGMEVSGMTFIGCILNVIIGATPNEESAMEAIDAITRDLKGNAANFYAKQRENVQ
jgi:hypothetical protein